jgi:hypothetical protein
MPCPFPSDGLCLVSSPITSPVIITSQSQSGSKHSQRLDPIGQFRIFSPQPGHVPELMRHITGAVHLSVVSACKPLTVPCRL